MRYGVISAWVLTATALISCAKTSGFSGSLDAGGTTCTTDCDVGCGADCDPDVAPALDADDSGGTDGSDGLAPDVIGDGGGPDTSPGDTVVDKPDVPYDCEAEGTCPPVGGAEILKEGTTNAYRLRGLIVTPEGPINGEVLVIGDSIACVGDCEGHAQSGGAWLIDTNAAILPGLIDTHNHILFDIFDNDDWVPTLPQSCSSETDCAAGTTYCKSGACACVDGRCRYRNHDQWPKEDEYALMLDYKQCFEGASQGRPDWCPTKYNDDGDVKCEMQKWGELKGLISGTTSIVGLPGTASKCVGSLSRSIDVAQNGLGVDDIQTSALFPPSKSSGDGACKNLESGDTTAYLIHAGEGTDAVALAEFETLSTFTTTDGCLLRKGTVITHGTAFGPAEFGVMAAAGVQLTWSPASNVALYGSTTDIPAALAAGLNISLAPDWSMGGSQNLLDELRFAHAWDQNVFGDVLTTRDLFDMVTANAAKVLALEARIGAIEVGLVADLLIIDLEPGGDPYESLISSTPTNVRLVMVGGAPLFGDKHLRTLAPSTPACDFIETCNSSKFLCAAQSAPEDKLNQSFPDIEAALATAFDELDAIPVADPLLCGTCKTDEECFKFTAKPVVDPGQCATPCTGGQLCIQAAKSGANQFKCESEYTCSPRKSQKYFSPLAPLVRCD